MMLFYMLAEDVAIVVVVGCTPQDARKPDAISDQSSKTVALKARETEGSSMQLTTYLLLDGTCKEAMTFYHAVFGGELTMTTIGDSPMKAAFPATMHGKIVNARLKSKVVEISASDWLRPTEKLIRGNTVCLYVSGGNPDDTKAIFGKLSVGAEVTDPLVDQPFGLYGALTDKFGTRWMFHSEKVQ